MSLVQVRSNKSVVLCMRRSLGWPSIAGRLMGKTHTPMSRRAFRTGKSSPAASMTRTMPSLLICECSISCSAKTIPRNPISTRTPGGVPTVLGFPSTGFTPGKNLHFDILSGAPFGLPANLTYWNGTGSPHFGLVPNGETLRLDLAGGLADATAGSGNSFIPGFNIGTFDSSGDLHVHLASFIQGSGGNNPSNGIYMMVLDPSTDMPVIAAAKPIFVLWDNGLGDGGQLAAAVNYAQATFVPEPSSILLVSIGSVGLGFAIWLKRSRGVVRS